MLGNRKPEHRRGRVQLIDATGWFVPLRKNLGRKNCALSEADIQRICDTFLAFEETEHSKIFSNQAFGYWKVTVERPLRLRVELDDATLSAFRAACETAGEAPLADLVDRATEAMGAGPHPDFNAFVDALGALVAKSGAKLTAKRQKLLREALATRDEAAAPVIRKVHWVDRVEADPLRGRHEAVIAGKAAVVEHEPDAALRDTAQVPLLEEGGIEAFLRREVLPHAPDAWYDEASVKVGYEISFTGYFYRPQPLRTLEEIRADILAVERETEGLLAEIVGTEAR